MTTTHHRPDTAHAVARPAGDRNTDLQPPAAQPGVTIGRVVRSELIKLRSLRSSYVAIVCTVLSIIGIGAFAAFGATIQDAPPGGEAPVDVTGGALTGVNLAVYLVAVLGVLAVTGEYSTGTIKASLAAVPKRSTLVWGKALAVGSITLVVTLVSTVSAFFAAKAVLSTDDTSISLAEPGVLRAVAGAALYLTAASLFAGGLAWLLRSTAGALATLFGILEVLPVTAYLLPGHIRDAVLPYLPDSVGMAIMQTTPSPAQLPPWTGFGVFAAYTAVILLAATLLLRHRDA